MLVKLNHNPIDNIVWLDPNTLIANDYNPNHVFNTELELLEFSIKTNGWIQPILVSTDYIIIDGFHRHLIGIKNNWFVPCVVMDLSTTERMFLTIRINRAKGSHAAYKMADIIKTLVKDFGVSKKELCTQIGAKEKEIELLLMEDVFEKHEVSKHQYSKAWLPNPKKS